MQDRLTRIARQDRTERLAELASGDWYADATLVPSKHDPGAVFEYGPSHFYAFAELLERKLAARSDVAEKSFESYSRARLFDPIGLQIGYWGKDRAGNVNTPGGMHLTAREWAKFGQFVLQEGSWQSSAGIAESLLAPELLHQCFVPSSTNPSYGLTWWLSGVGTEADDGTADGNVSRTWQDRLRQRLLQREADTQIDVGGRGMEIYMAAGLGKQRLYVIPERKLVVVRFAEPTREGNSFSNAQFLEPILKAFEAPGGESGGS